MFDEFYLSSMVTFSQSILEIISSSCQSSQSSCTIVTSICFHWLPSLSHLLRPNAKLASYQLILQPAGKLTLKRPSSSKWSWLKPFCPPPSSWTHPPISPWLFILYRKCHHFFPLAKLAHGSALFPWTRSLVLFFLLSWGSLDQNCQQQGLGGFFAGGCQKCWLELRSGAAPLWGTFMVGSPACLLSAGL